MARPRLRGPYITGPFFGPTHHGFGWITDVWVVNVTTRKPYMMRVFSKREGDHERHVHEVINRLLHDATT